MRFFKLIFAIQACIFSFINADVLFFNHSGRDLILNGKNIMQNEDLSVKLQNEEKIEIKDPAGQAKIVILPVCRKSTSKVRGRSITRTICDDFKEIEAQGLQVVSFSFSTEDGSQKKAYEIKVQ